MISLHVKDSMENSFHKSISEARLPYLCFIFSVHSGWGGAVEDSIVCRLLMMLAGVWALDPVAPAGLITASRDHHPVLFSSLQPVDSSGDTKGTKGVSSHSSNPQTHTHSLTLVHQRKHWHHRRRVVFNQIHCCCFFSFLKGTKTVGGCFICRLWCLRCFEAQGVCFYKRWPRSQGFVVMQIVIVEYVAIAVTSCYLYLLSSQSVRVEHAQSSPLCPVP